MALFKKIIDEVAGCIHSVNLHHRGEPLLHGELTEMIKYCSRKTIRTQIHTNGTLLTDDLSRAIVEAKLNLISFSFDGFDAPSYEGIRVGADFKKTVSNIKKFIEIRRRLKSEGPRVVLEFIDFYNGDPEKITRIEDLGREIGPDQLIIKKAHNWGGSYTDPRTGDGVDNRWAFWPACTLPWYTLTIFWDGTVVACPQDFYGESAIGNVENDSLFHLWNHPVQIEQRNQLKKKRIDHDPCRACDRISQKQILGIPTEPLKGFLKNIL